MQLRSRSLFYVAIVTILVLTLQSIATLKLNFFNQYQEFLTSAVSNVEAVGKTVELSNDLGATPPQRRMHLDNSEDTYQKRKFYSNDALKQQPSSWPQDEFWNRTGCQNWGVVATVSTPTPAVRQFASLNRWCLVVITDQEGPESYEISNAKGTVVFLSVARQKELAKYVPFVKRTLWNHASRKNIAYLYAIANGAEFVWDFEDDISISRAGQLTRYTSKPLTTTQVLVADRRNRKECGVFNPFPFFRPSDKSLWPRGLPLDRVDVPGCKLAPRYYLHDVASKDIGIIQSVVDQNPDGDHVSRLIRQRSIEFEGVFHGDHPVAVPPRTMAPTNSQSTLYSRFAMWGLLLPSTVHSVVTDTWRSYITQALATRCGMLVAFAGPLATREQPSNRLTVDLVPEMQAQEKLGKLVSFLLNDWEYPHSLTLDGAMERLYADLYEIGVVEREDVEMAQLWILALQSVGYQFPAFQTYRNSELLLESPTKQWKWTGGPFDDVVLVGQFNYNTGAANIGQWARRWREVFKRIDVRGPFDNATMASLRLAGINPFMTAGEWGGLYSPMKSMGDSLRLYQKDPSVRGVIVAHDDLLFNVSRLVELGFPTDDSIMGKFLPSVMAEPYMYMYGNGTLRQRDNVALVPASEFATQLYTWHWWEEIVPQIALAATKDPDRQKYMGADGSIPIYSHAQSDFVYVPTFDSSMATEYANFADLMYRNEIMLEIGTPTILGRMKVKFNTSINCVELCTKWDENRNDVMAWMPSCVQNWTEMSYGLYHPIKAKTMGLDLWNAVFDLIVLGRGDLKALEAFPRRQIQHNQPRQKQQKRRPRTTLSGKA